MLIVGCVCLLWQVLVSDLKWNPGWVSAAVPVSGGQVMIALNTIT